MILVSWRKTGEEWQSREYPDDRLQELMDRAWEAFGDKSLPQRPTEIMKIESEPISQVIRTPRRKK